MNTRLLLLFLIASIGCAKAEPLLETKVPRFIGLQLALDRTLTVCGADSRPLGCATAILADDGYLYLASSLDLFSENGIKLVLWREVVAGQKFECTELLKPELLDVDQIHKVAVLKVACTFNLPPIKYVDSQSSRTLQPFVGYGARIGKLKPLEPVPLKSLGAKSARASEHVEGTKFIEVEGGVDFKMLGSPLISDYGELAGVAVGHLWDTRLYCPADRIFELLRKHVPFAVISF